MHNFPAITKLEVPLVVRLGERVMRVSEVLGLLPGSIIELGKSADEPLDLMANDKVVGSGFAMKVGENFGIRINCIGDEAERLAAMMALKVDDEIVDPSTDALAEQMLAGQL